MSEDATEPAPEGEPPGPWTHGYAVGAGGVRLHYVEQRPEGGGNDAPLVILLHGFPEFW